MCGLEIHVDGDQVALIRADRDDVWSKGYLCPKGTTLGHLHHDPDRLRAADGPRGRDVARGHLGRGVRPVLRAARPGDRASTASRRSPRTSATRSPTTSASAATSAILIGMSGIPMIYSAGTVDQWPKNVSSHLMYGGMWKIPVPDIQRTDLLVVMGAQPAGVAGLAARLPRRDGRDRRASARGAARSSSIDPRRTGTADKADEWLPITPGHRRRVAARDRATCCSPRARSTSATSPTSSTASTTSRRSSPTGRPSGSPASPASRPSASARSPTSSPTPSGRSVYGRIGLCNQEFGTLASWLVDVVNILTGHFDVAGRADVPAAGGRGRSPTCRCPGSRAACPTSAAGRPGCAARPRCSATCRCRASPRRSPRPGDGQIRALFTVAGNPVLSTPGGDRLDAALAGLDCMISVDNWLNETTRHADVILPGPVAARAAAPRRPHLAVRGRQRRPTARRRSSRPPTAGPRSGRSSSGSAGACLGQRDGRGRRGRDRRRLLRRARRGQGLRRRRRSRAQLRPTAGPSGMLDLTLRTGPFGDRYGEDPDGLTLEKLKAEPHGIDLGPMVPQAADVVAHRRRARSTLAPAVHHRRPAPARGPARPAARAAGARQPPPPALEQLVDAQRQGAGEGQGPLHAARPPRRRRPHAAWPTATLATVRSEAGTIDVPVEVTDEHRAGRGVAPPRLGPRQGRAPGSRSPTSTPA